MIRLKENTKRLTEEYLRQDFYPHEQSNGKVIMVSADFMFYYEPTY